MQRLVDSSAPAPSAAPAPWSWAVGPVRLEVRQGSLLDAPEPAWVSSEQSDFVPASLPDTVSGLLCRAWPRCREELWSQTRGEVLPAGTVLETSGPARRRIYHAGFHEPDGWLGLGEDDAVPYYAETIRRCVEDVLARVDRDGLEGVAFPLIGTGLFELPVPVFAHLFFTAVGVHARRRSRPLRVALCVWRDEDLEPVVRHGTQALAALVGGGAPLLREAGGHALVRELRPLARALADERLQEHALLQFAEVALTADFAVASELGRVPVAELASAAQSGDRGVFLTFGLVRNRLEALLQRRNLVLPRWAAGRLERLRSSESLAAIGRLVQDRNEAAHLRQPRPIADIVSDVDHLFGPEALDEEWPDLDGRRWVRRFDRGHGLLDGVDLVHRTCTWLLPVHRERVGGPLPD